MRRHPRARLGASGTTMGGVVLALACGRAELAGPAGLGVEPPAPAPDAVLDAGGPPEAAASEAAPPDASRPCAPGGRVTPVPFDLSAAIVDQVGPQLAVTDVLAVAEPGSAGRCPIRDEPVVALIEPPAQTVCARAAPRASAVWPVDGGHLLAASGLGGRLDILRARWRGAGDPAPEEGGRLASWRSVLFASSYQAHTPRAVAERGGRAIVAGAYADGTAHVLAFDVAAVEAGFVDVAVVQHDEPRLVSLDGLSLRADGRFWASGRTPGGKLALMRFGADERPETSFGDAGLVVVEGTADVRATKVATTPDGGALVAAVHASGGMTVRRFTADGALDAAYGAEGVLVSPFPAGGHVEPGRAQIALEPRTGAARFAGVLADPAPSGALRIRMTRILSNGAADPAFGVSGVADADVALPNGAPWPPGEPYLLFDGSEDLGACEGKLAFALARIAQRGSSPGLSGPGVAGTVAP